LSRSATGGRLWITGVGVVSPLGRTASSTMDRIVAGERGFSQLTLFSAEGMRASLVGEIAGLTAAEVAPPGEDEGWSRTDAMSVIAVREALAQAGVTAEGADLIVGGTTAGMYETEDTLAWLSRDPSAITPLAKMLSHPLSATADHVHQAVGPFRRTRSVCSACSSGANAILLGASWLRAGRSKRVVAGGADGLCRLTLSGFGALAALDPNPCRPFDRRRAGLNLGEAAAFVVLERAEDAIARGASPIAELAGWAVGAESHHITNPEPTGATATRVMQAALARAGLTPADIDYVNAHGTATPLNDSMETRAIRGCLGAETERVRVSSTKGQIGHTLAAAGAIEAVITALAIQRGVVPPTAGLEEVDPECALRHVMRAESTEIRAAMSNSFGFGGTDTVLVLAKPGRFPVGFSSGERRRVVVTAGSTVGALGVLDAAQSLAYLEPGPPPSPGAISFQAADHLDIARARRLDRAGRLTTVAMKTALESAAIDATAATLRTGAIGGASFGSVDGSTAYMRRIYDKGAKYASPADFPNLVPSSPVGHASIYLGLRGVVLAAADLGATAESTIAIAAELIEAGEGDALFAGSSEEASPMIERCLGPICSEIHDRAERSEGASGLLLEAETTAVDRGARILARLIWWDAWRGARTSPLPEMPADAVVLVGRSDGAHTAALDGTAWASAPRRVLASRAGDHEGAGGFAAVAAAGLLQRGDVTAALVIGGAPDRGYGLLFVAP
jgi:3-oxoacyl-[acyl-carrier-protein] synthase II